MNKLIRFAVGASFLMALFFGSEVRAQQKVYVEQVFADGSLSDVWDGVDNLFYSMTLSNDKSYGGWIYDPQGVFFQSAVPGKVSGFHSMKTKPFAIDETGDVYLFFNSVYRTLAQSGVRNMGLRLGNEESGWDTLYVIRKEGEVLPKSTQGTYDEQKMKLDDKFKGRDSLVFEFFVYNDATATDGFILGIGDILLASFDTEANVSLSVASQPYFYEENSKLVLNVSNSSTENIDSIKVGMAVDGGEVVTAACSFSTALEMLAQQDAEVDFSLQGVEKGSHVLKVWVTEINGKASVTGTEDTLAFDFLYAEEGDLTPFRPILEVMTASWCPPCAQMNAYLNPALETMVDAEQISVVKFQQSGDRYAISEGNTRYFMYSAINPGSGVPCPVYNGLENTQNWGGGFPNQVAMLKQRVSEDITKKSSLRIEFGDIRLDEATGMLDLIVNVTSLVDVQYNVGIVITEGTTTGNRGTNGETEFHWVAMAMPTGAKGKTTDFEAGKPVEFKYSVDMSETHAEEYTDLQIVCFVQDMNTLEMLQSNQYILTDKNVGVETDQVLTGVSLYPNPARTHFNLVGAENARVEFFDLMGRKVYGLENVTGERVISTDLFKAGTYVVRISQNGQTSVRKITVVK